VVTVGVRRVEAFVNGDGTISLDLGPVEVGELETLDLGDERVEFTPVSVGNPHAVIRREPERGELRRLGPKVERHARFPERTNVQLVRVDGAHDVTVGVWERGAGETLSSGTSSVAAAAAAVMHGWCESPVHVHLPGGDLLVELRNGTARLTGPAVEICRIELA
jgi:diaminopimelate epimerase